MSRGILTYELAGSLELIDVSVQEIRAEQVEIDADGSTGRIYQSGCRLTIRNGQRTRLRSLLLNTPLAA
ncbi:MAG: hypothetical protein ABSA54_21670 [Terriglobales bacterium]|jgi:hypothetical protein